MASLGKLLTVLLSSLLGFGWDSAPSNMEPLRSQDIDKVAFAECLNEKGFVFYGLDTCEHCNEQKAVLGDGALSVEYIECSENKKACYEKEIASVPTWIYPQGRAVGLQSLEELSELSSCELKSSSIISLEDSEKVPDTSQQENSARIFE